MCAAFGKSIHSFIRDKIADIAYQVLLLSYLVLLLSAVT